jgi:hypothetical protein
VLKDGSDSVGALGALNRVFLNIGLFSEEWLLHFKPLIGGKQITPIEIRVARKNSTYWDATEAQTPNLALFFLKTTAPHKLKDAPGGDKYLTTNAPLLLRGKEMFAERAAIPASCLCRLSVSIRTAAQDPAIWSVGTSTGTGRRPTSSNER